MIVWPATHFPPFGQDTGSGESVRLAAEGLAARGQEIAVVTPNWTGEAPVWEHQRGVLIHRYDVGAPGDRLPSERFFLGRVWRCSAVTAILGLATAHRVRLIHAQDRRLIGAAHQAARLLGVPWAVTLRDTGLLCPVCICLQARPDVPPDCGQVKLWRECAKAYRAQYGGDRGLRLRLAYRYAALERDRRVAQRANLVAFVSEGLREVYRSAGWGPERTAVLYSPVGEKQMLPVLTHSLFGVERVVLYVGKPSRGKGWHLFRMAASELFRQAAFVHVGQRAAYEPAIWSADQLIRPDTLAWMRAATVVCVPPTIPDALPRVALESLSQGTPVLATPVGGLPEIIQDGVNGWLAKPQEYTERLRTILQDPEGIKRASDRARASVLAKFCPAVTADTMLARYEEIGVCV